MAAPRYSTFAAGVRKWIAAITASAGVGDAEKIVATNTSGILDPTLVNAKNTSAGAGDVNKIPMLDASGRLDTSFMPVGIGADTKIVVTTEALAAGDLVNIWNSTGAKARKADATVEGKEAVGFVLSAVGNGGDATVYFEGQITGLSGMTPGARQYLSTSAGLRTETAPSAAGNVIQFVGIALDATTLAFEPEDATTIV